MLSVLTGSQGHQRMQLALSFLTYSRRSTFIKWCRKSHGLREDKACLPCMAMGLTWIWSSRIGQLFLVHHPSCLHLARLTISQPTAHLTLVCAHSKSAAPSCSPVECEQVWQESPPVRPMDATLAKRQQQVMFRHWHWLPLGKLAFPVHVLCSEACPI